MLMIIVALAFMGYFVVPGGHFLPGTTVESFLHTSIIIPVDLEYVRNMAENTEEKVAVENSWVENTFKHWSELTNLTGVNAKRFALEQTLHKASLMGIEDWDKVRTPGEIADFILKTVPGQVDWWLTRRHELRILEQNKHDTGFRRVFMVKNELAKRIKK